MIFKYFKNGESQTFWTKPKKFKNDKLCFLFQNVPGFSHGSLFTFNRKVNDRVFLKGLHGAKALVNLFYLEVISNPFLTGLSHVAVALSI